MANSAQTQEEKKKRRKMALWLLSSVFTITFLGVFIGSSLTSQASPSFIKIDESFYILEEGQSTLISFTASEDLGAFIYTSHDTSVVQFVENRLVSVGPGSTTITVSSLSNPSIFQTVSVIVRDTPPVTPPVTPPTPPVEPEVPAEPEPEVPAEPEPEVPAEPEPEVPSEPEPEVPSEPEPEVPVVDEPDDEEVVTPPSIVTVTLTNETGEIVQTLTLEEGSIISEDDLDLPDNFKGLFLDGQTCSDDSFDLDTPITENLTLIQVSFNNEAPCIQLDYIVLNGRPTAGSTLSVDVFPIGANVSISWYTSVNNRTYREIPGETGSTFTVRPEDSGKFIRVYVVSDSNPPVVRYDTIKMDVFSTLSNGGSGGNEIASKTPLTEEEINVLFAQGIIPIASLEDLIAINSENQHSFAGTHLTEGGFSKSYVVVRDINLTTDTAFVASLINGVFTGTFEGKDYTISNFTIDASSVNNIGLFSQISGASIQNLTLQAFNITGNKWVGALVGIVTGGANIVENIHVLGSMINGDNRVGGLLGAIGSSQLGPDPGNLMTLSSINYSGDVNGQGNEGRVGGIVGEAENFTIDISDITYTGNVKGDSQIGGILGGVYGSTLTAISVNNKGKVIGSGGSVGGIVGLFRGPSMTISNSANTEEVIGGVYVGGIAGYVRNGLLNISNVINSGSITSYNQYAGGIIGFVDQDNTVTISNATNSGMVTGGALFAGGIIGLAQYSLIDIYNISNEGDIEGSEYVGGVIGVIQLLMITMTSIINDGTVTAQDDYAGGIVGYIFSTNLTGSNITVTGPGSTTGAAATTGHIIGVIQPSTDNDFKSTVNLTGIQVDRPNNTLKLVGENDVDHAISDADGTTVKEGDIFTNASITKP